MHLPDMLSLPEFCDLMAALLRFPLSGVSFIFALVPCFLCLTGINAPHAPVLPLLSRLSSASHLSRFTGVKGIMSRGRGPVRVMRHFRQSALTSKYFPPISR